MSAGERRTALGGGKVARRHPAEPLPPAETPRLEPKDSSRADEGLVMLCVRVTPALRRRLKLVSAASGRPIQALVGDALDVVCKQHDM